MLNSSSIESGSPKSLDGIRVIDFTWVRAGPWANRWLGSLGAQIIKVEWPLNADLLRGNVGSTPQDIEPTLNTSGQFNDTNANKFSISLNLRSEKGLDTVKKLISMADVVIENFSSRVMENIGLSYDQLKKLQPNIIYVSMAGFGHTGRHHSYTTFGSSAQALSGQSFISGLPGEVPAGWGWSYLDDTGGMYGAMTVLTALHHRNVTGEGQYVDLSQMITGITLTGSALLDKTVNNREARREGYPPGNRAHWPNTPLLNNYRGRTTAPHNAYRTNPADYNDWCVIVCFSDKEWESLIEVMGNPDWALDPKFASTGGRLENQQELDQGIEEWTITMPKYEIMRLCQSKGVRSMPVQSSEDRVENDAQLDHRDMYLPLEHPVLGVRKLQNAPFKLSETPSINYRTAPLIGQHNNDILQGLLGMSHADIVQGYEDGTFWPKDMDKYPYVEDIINLNYLHRDLDLILPNKTYDSKNSSDTKSTPIGPFYGLRILELADEKSQWCGKLLGDLGADVIRIEPPGVHETRTVGPFLDDIPGHERSLAFWHYNTSKRGITLNLESINGQKIFKQLASSVDVILDATQPGYLSSLGIGYDEVSKDNVKLIMCSITEFGQTGPWKDYLMSDLLHLAAGGQMAMCGYLDEQLANSPPIAPGGGQSWHMAGHYAYIGIMAALNYRDKSGRGQYIDLSVHDSCALTTEGHVNTWIYRKQVMTRGRPQLLCKDGLYVNAAQLGFRMAPRVVKGLAEWLDTYGMAEDLLDEDYQRPEHIQENIQHIMDVIRAFTATRTSDEVYHGAQERGYPWGTIRSTDELANDNHLVDREFWVEVEHPDLGRTFSYPGAAAIYNGSPWKISRRAPLIGEHNEEILCGEIGLSKQDIIILSETGVI
jgi:crotonobetainyl-CoA:carnitine CoA-transferase CaiB-like acyl-CoA transferase